MSIYESKHYKLLLLIPLALLLVSIFFATQVKLGIDLKGGTLLMAPVSGEVDADAFKAQLESNFELADLEVRTTSGATQGIYIEFAGEKNLLLAQDALEAKDYAQVIELSKTITGELDTEAKTEADEADIYFSTARQTFKDSLVGFISSELQIPRQDFSIKDTGPALGGFFLNQALTAIALAFVFITALVFYYFRTPIVAFAAVQCVFFDVLLGYSVLGMFGIPLSLATIAPLLMLIGYSIDTDIMLNDRMLKRKLGSPIERLNGAIKTGLTMTLTAIFTMSSLLIISYYANITILFQISLILLIGLIGDLIATWFTNAVLILWYLERKEKKRQRD